MHQKDEADTFDRICVFLKDFEVSPQLIYKSICYVVFLHVIRSKEDKHRFQIDDLKYLLIYVAELLGRREFGDSLCQLSKLIRVLQHMELSAGFLKMVQKTQTESSQLISFFKSISLPNR